MARRRKGTMWERTRQAAFNRDAKANAVCHICKGKIDYKLRPSSEDYAYEPDHIKPVSKYPELEYDLANVAASHRICNRRRKDRASIDLLGNQSREW